MRLQPNGFGLTEGLVGLALSFVVAGLAVAGFAALSGHPSHPGTFGADVTSLVVYWCCWLAAAIYAAATARRRRLLGATPSDPGPAAAAAGADADEGADADAGAHAGAGAHAAARRGAGAPATASARRLLARLRADYGLELRLWPDVPMGAAVGVASQYLLVPVVEAPLAPFVPHLYRRLGGPAYQLAGGAHGAASLAVLGVLVCIGSPLFEELFFRGLLLRAVAGRLAGLAPLARACASIGLVAALFGLAHFEPLQLLGLVGFGAVLGVLAWRSGRLGPGIAAHAAFNAVAFLQLALAR